MDSALEKRVMQRDPFGKLFPKGAVRDRSWKGPSKGLERSPQGLYTVQEMYHIKQKHERMLSRGQLLDENMGKRAFKIKKVKVTRGTQQQDFTERKIAQNQLMSIENGYMHTAPGI